MTDHRCLPPEELETIAALAPGDHRRAHLEHCPRCRNLVRLYQDFVSPPPLPPEAQAAEAGRELRRRLAAALPGLSLVAGEGRGGQNGGAPDRARFWRRSARPLIALAAVFVCCLGLFALRQQLLEPADRVPGSAPALLRGAAEPSSTTLAVGRSPDGVRLSWQRPADADRTVVVLLDEAWQEVARVVAADGDTYLLSAAETARARYARVLFEDRGDVVATTRTVVLP
ncbi:MAG TPA: hypothetical protein PLL30_11260 [Candidatus Krumholzibacteria bacterium]|nr:hypothetical protein [Candidatus Krumholzibacteria bacterium]HPD72344.1 hypothetical protein [Candidatus Krumholzibacteria bacterium]HRY40724.1 hypothetical protein [Candidatus Krumholzibacteria bacterium]